MFVQGWGQLAQLNTSKSESGKNRNRPGASCVNNSVTMNNSENNNSAVSDRKELLKSIKGKIKSGFYTSDSVLEDLSHGFAKIFDKNI